MKSEACSTRSVVVATVAKRRLTDSIVFYQISPELITVNGPAPGALAPPKKATLPGGEGKVADMPFARLPRIDRLRVSGKYDATEEPESDEDVDLDEVGEDGETDEMKAKRERMKEKVVKKMRGKNKAMKRCVIRRLILLSSLTLWVSKISSQA